MQLKSLLTLVVSLFLVTATYGLPTEQETDQKEQTELLIAEGGEDSHSAEGHEGEEHAEEGHHPSPSPISVIPFVLLLLMIATGPLFYAHFWHKNYPVVSIVLGAIVVIYYLGFLHDQHHPVHSYRRSFHYFLR